jgi:hypothetical protein
MIFVLALTSCLSEKENDPHEPKWAKDCGQNTLRLHIAFLQVCESQTVWNKWLFAEGRAYDKSYTWIENRYEMYI